MLPETIFKILSYFDPHLTTVIIDFYLNLPQGESNFKQKLQYLKLQCVLKTRIVDDIQTECSKMLNPQTKQIIDGLESLKAETEEMAGYYKHYASPLFNFIEKNRMELEKNDFKKAAFIDNPEFANVDLLCVEYAGKFARILYDIGQYGDAYEYINQIHFLTPENEKSVPVYWGKILCELLIPKPAHAKLTIKHLQSKIDKYATDYMDIMSQRAQLMHTSLYVFLSEKPEDSDFDQIIDLFTNQEYINTIQMIVPHLIRYLFCATLLKRGQGKTDSYSSKTFAKFLSKKTCDYMDPFLLFCQKLFIEFDFHEANQLIKMFPGEVSNDFFLHTQAGALVQNANYLLIDTYCQVHDQLSIRMVSQFFELEEQKAEYWIVNFIRQANLNAKIDSENGIVIIKRQKYSFYEEIQQKTKDFIPKTQLMVSEIKKIMQSKKR